MRRRTRALAASALALMALAVPAAAQAEGPFWREDDTGENVYLSEPKQVGPLLEITAFTFSNGVVVGPCEMGAAWNGVFYNVEKVGGEGKIYEGSFGGACPTNLPGCVATVIPTFNWLVKLTMVGGKPIVDFNEAGFKFAWGAGCAIFGLAGETPVSGTLTGAFDNENSTVVFDKAGDLAVGAVTVKVDGEMGFGTLLTVTEK